MDLNQNLVVENMEHCKYLKQQFLNEKTADFFFVLSNGEEFAAHKVILAASSRMFEKQFNENVHLKKTKINNISSAAFREFLYTFYVSEKHYTIENIRTVLRLARCFDVDYLQGTCEQFLIENLTDDQMFFGYCIADEFQMAKLKDHCSQRINKEAVHCGKSNVGSLNMGKNLLTLTKYSDGFVVENTMQHHEALSTNSALRDSQPLQAEDDYDYHQFMAVRLLDKMLATQVCRIGDVVKIELKCTNEIVVKGIALSTVSGSHLSGKITVSFCGDEGESVLIDQIFKLMHKSCEPRNFISLGCGVVLKPNQRYEIRVNLERDVIYYRSYTTKNDFRQNGLNISFKSSKPDIISHLLFNAERKIRNLLNCTQNFS